MQYSLGKGRKSIVACPLRSSLTTLPPFSSLGTKLLLALSISPCGPWQGTSRANRNSGKNSSGLVGSPRLTRFGTVKLYRTWMPWSKKGTPFDHSHLNYFIYLPFLTKNNRLRLFPSSAHTEKVVVNDDVIPLRWPVRSPDGKHVLHEIPVTKGQVIHIPSRTVNRLARVWGSDAEEFVPERWLDPTRIPNSDDLTNGWSGLFSFSEGPRTCVGFRLGTFERGFVIIIHNN